MRDPDWWTTRTRRNAACGSDWTPRASVRIPIQTIGRSIGKGRQLAGVSELAITIRGITPAMSATPTTKTGAGDCDGGWKRAGCGELAAIKGTALLRLSSHDSRCGDRFRNGCIFQAADPGVLMVAPVGRHQFIKHDPAG